MPHRVYGESGSPSIPSRRSRLFSSPLRGAARYVQAIAPTYGERKNGTRLSGSRTRRPGVLVRQLIQARLIPSKPASSVAPIEAISVLIVALTIGPDARNAKFSSVQ